MPPSFMASVLDGPEADDMTKALEQDGDLVISAATVAEVLIVSRLRGVGKAMAARIAGLGATIAPVALVNAETGADACDRRGRAFIRQGYFGAIAAPMPWQSPKAALVYSLSGTFIRQSWKAWYRLNRPVSYACRTGAN